MVKLVLPLIILLLVLSNAWAQDDFECGSCDTGCDVLMNAIDTITGVAIYASWDTVGYTDTLPDYWKEIWDSTIQDAVPQYFINNSNYRHVVYAHPYGATDSTAFISSNKPFLDIGHGSDSGHFGFCREILTKSDSIPKNQWISRNWAG